uniref:Uncharacterized protein n=1 Tax=Pinguiococcus pyrenoidosus TaxID=172671 RepID=A0A7R9U5G1_9STRA|mmetsp:Transcript_14377/g.54224  ORF Transcript_14377/g.54224 Transcript_14377/m.54224 type:complete len:361 (+) Transcript_14377:162-1244(+)
MEQNGAESGARPPLPDGATVADAALAQKMEEITLNEKLDALQLVVDELSALEATLNSLLAGFTRFVEHQRQTSNSTLDMHEILRGKAGVFDAATQEALVRFKEVTQQSRAKLESELLTPTEMGVIQSLRNVLSHFQASRVELADRRKQSVSKKTPGILTEETFTAKLAKLSEQAKLMVKLALNQLMETQIQGARLQQAELESLTSLSEVFSAVNTEDVPLASSPAEDLAAPSEEARWTLETPKGFSFFRFISRSKSVTGSRDVHTSSDDGRRTVSTGDGEGAFPRTNPNLGGRSMPGIGQSNIFSENGVRGSFPRPGAPEGSGVFPRTAGDLGSGKPMPGVGSSNMIAEDSAGAFPRQQE